MLNYKVGIFGALADSKFNSKVEPIIALDDISLVYLYRATNCIPNVYQYKIKYSKILKYLPKKLFFIYSFIKILLLGINNKIDLIISIYFYPYGLITSIIQKIIGIPVVHFLTGTDLKRIIESKKDFRRLSLGNKIVVRGENSKKSLQTRGIKKNKILVLSNYFKIDRKPIISETKKYDIIFVGYLRELKRLDLFIEIISRVSKQISNLKCKIVGDGPMRDKLKLEVKNRGLDETIHFFDYQKDVYYHLQNSKMFLLTSESEGLPMAIIEAMYCGLPVVTPAINDIPDIVHHGENGFLVTPYNISEFCKYTLKILNNSKIYNQLSKNAFKSAFEYSKKSSLDFLMKEWEHLLAEIIS